MQSAGIAEALDLAEQVGSRLVAGGVDAVMYALDLERLEEAFHRRVVEAVAGPAHRGRNTCGSVARRRGVTRWQVYDWRRKLAAGTLAVPTEATGEPAFAALVVEPPAAVSTRKPRTAQKSLDRIELVVAGVTVRVAADVEEVQLTRVIRAVRAASA